jgi:F0F1-type ATP synthase assembly protein I
MQKKDFQDLKKKKEELSKFSYYSSMAFQMLVLIFAGVLGGVLIDKWLVLKFPVFTIILSLLGIFLALYTTLKDLFRSDK